MSTTRTRSATYLLGWPLRRGPAGTGTGALVVIDNFTTIDGAPTQYHTAHEWMFRQGVLQILMWYVHEYPSFDLAWRKG